MPRRRKRIKIPPHRLVLLGVVVALLIYFIYFWPSAEATRDFNARVLFAETANCTTAERKLVLGVMHNRIKNPAFGNLDDLNEVIRQPGAFSCIDDAGNANWKRSLYPTKLSKRERAVWEECVSLLLSGPMDAKGPSGRELVYYHDKSISMPPSWRNAKWTAKLEVTTEHFLFYSVVATR